MYEEFCTELVHGPIVILVPTRRTKDDCCELIAHKVEIEILGRIEKPESGIRNRSRKRNWNRKRNLN